MKFDLSSVRELPAAQSRHRVGLAGLGLIVTFAIFGPGLLISEYSIHRGFEGWLSGLIIVLIITTMMVGFGAFFVRTGRVIAIALEVDAKGFCFDFGDSRPWRSAWLDPGLRLQFVRLNGKSTKSDAVLAWGGSAHHAYVTEEAFAELVKQASANGLRSVETRPTKNPSASLTTVTK